jgi:hypothetical protein
VIADDIALISRAKNRVASLIQRFEPNAFGAPEKWGARLAEIDHLDCTALREAH